MFISCGESDGHVGNIEDRDTEQISGALIS